MGVSNQKGNEPESVVKKRRWRSAEERRAIAEASLQAGTSAREVAERYGVHPSQVGKWRRQYRKGGLEGSTPAPAMLAVGVADDVQPDQTSRSSKSKVNGRGLIHIEFARARVSIEGIVDAATLQAVLASLAG
jgi:transposase-like protein